MNALRFATSVATDLKRIRAFDRSRIIESMESQLLEEPTTPTRHRKLLVNLVPPWSGELPVWELRVGEYRIFYDVSEDEELVYVRAVRKKPPEKRTEEIL